jgi:hypothetical protein
MSLKVVIRVIHQGQGRKIRIDTLSSWNELLQKISSKLNNQTIETIQDSDGDIVDDLEVLSHGDIITVTTVTPSTVAMIHNENNHSAGETKATDDAATATTATTASTATTATTATIITIDI